MKILYDIRPYKPEDELQLLELVRKTPIKGTFTFINEKKRFLDRANLYSDNKCFVVELEGKIIGVCCAATKNTKINGKTRQIGYVFDMRVDPDYRGQRIATNLLLEIGGAMIAEGVDLFYVLIDDRNIITNNMFTNVKAEAEIISPLYLGLFPIYKREMVLPDEIKAIKIPIDDISQYLHQKHKNDNFYTKVNAIFDSPCYFGSYSISTSNKTKFSIWDEENIRKERIIGVPLKYRILDKIFALISPIKKLPRIPKENDYYRTLYIFNIESDSPRNLNLALKLINNLAFDQNYNLVIFPLIPDPDNFLFDIIKKKAFSMMKMNIVGLKLIDLEFDPSKKIYFDIRDI
ncbi:MAG: GNAT family N-acetyltransferase [Candidatus Hodarchaeota archaeon]